ncbi:hypothetical protein F3J20_22485 [Paraburkholderia sp. Cy-641]|uniref:hypothetical protein n=1 Tax=Paraburkholderia sp. Cy-641 TaxID=2608337 RepID=UPI0014213183|nr:hypothetical protein [Paraburkholderia sp. Cy-641]NIF80125.1 hypothetical protein [Paraburkholderia sp. Cy-641]
MTRLLSAFLVASLAGCTLIEHVQVLPILNPNTDDVSCCVAYAEILPSTRLSLSVSKSNAGVKVKAGAKWKF